MRSGSRLLLHRASKPADGDRDLSADAGRGSARDVARCRRATPPRTRRQAVPIPGCTPCDRLIHRGIGRFETRMRAGAETCGVAKRLETGDGPCGLVMWTGVVAGLGAGSRCEIARRVGTERVECFGSTSCSPAGPFQAVGPRLRLLARHAGMLAAVLLAARCFVSPLGCVTVHRPNGSFRASSLLLVGSPLAPSYSLCIGLRQTIEWGDIVPCPQSHAS